MGVAARLAESSRWRGFANSAAILWIRGYDEPDPDLSHTPAGDPTHTAPQDAQPAADAPTAQPTSGETIPSTPAVFYPSAELLLSVALDDRQARVGTLDALQTKVGVMLALASALVVLADSWEQTVFRVASAIPAALAALFCLADLFTRGVEFTDMRRARSYTSMEPSATARRLYDTIVGKDRHLRRSLTLARRTVDAAGLLLFVSTAVNVAALLLDTPQPPTP